MEEYFVHELAYTPEELAWCDNGLKVGVSYDLDSGYTLLLTQTNRVLTLELTSSSDGTLFTKDLDLNQELNPADFSEFSVACKSASPFYSESIDFMIDRSLKALKQYVSERV